MTTTNTSVKYTAESLQVCRLADIAHLLNNTEEDRGNLLAALRAILAVPARYDVMPAIAMEMYEIARRAIAGEPQLPVKRPVWLHLADCGADSYDTVAEGRAVHGRGPDLWALYERDAEGMLVHVRDLAD